MLEVGKPYIVGQSQWTEAVGSNYRAGAHELRMFFSAPGAQVVLQPAMHVTGGLAPTPKQGNRSGPRDL